MSDAPSLRRSIGLVPATALVVGTIIGSSIFVQPSEITRDVPWEPALIAVWIASGILTLFGALVCAELASSFPETGGVYVFLSRTFSPALGFLWGWAMFWSMHSGIVAALAVVFASYASYFVHLDAVSLRAVAIAVILAISAINYVGVKWGGLVQTAFTIGKIAAIVTILGVAFWLAPHAGPAVRATTGARAAHPVLARDFLRAMIGGLFAFGGWHMVTYAAGETVDPRRTIPRALVIGTLIVTACYIALNVAYLRVLSIERLIASKRVAADAADALMGGGGGAFMSALVMFSTFGSLVGIILAGPRVYYSMAQDGLLFTWIADVHGWFRTPHRAIILQAIWASTLVATGTYRALFTRVVYTEWIFFGLLAAGLFVLRRRPGYAPRYRVWGCPWVPIVFVAATLAVVLNQFWLDPIESATGLLIVLAGIPIYLIFRVRTSGSPNTIQPC